MATRCQEERLWAAGYRFALLHSEVTILHLQVEGLISRTREIAMLYQTPDLTDEERAVVARVEELRRSLRFQVSGNPRRWTGSLRPGHVRARDPGLQHHRGLYRRPR